MAHQNIRSLGILLPLPVSECTYQAPALIFVPMYLNVTFFIRPISIFLALHLYFSAAIINAQSATPIHLSSAAPFTDGFARVENGAETYFIDTAGKFAFDQMLPLEGYTGANSRFNRVLVQNKISHKNKWGIIKNGQWILQPVYDSIDTRFTEWKLLQNGKRTWCDTTGKLLAPLRFSNMGYLDGHYFDVRQNGKWGIYDARTDSLIIPIQYDGFDYCGGCSLASDYVLASKNKKWGVIGFDNKVRVPFEYEHEHSGMRSDEWVHSLYRKGKRVLINMNTGKIFAEPEYEFPDDMLWNGLVCLIKNNKYGLLTATGKPVTKFEYDYITWFEDVRNRMNNYACVGKNGKYGIIDTTGAIIIPLKYKGLIWAYDDSTFLVDGEKEKMLLDRAGNRLLPESYTDIQEMTVGDNAPWLFAVVKNDKYRLFNRRSKELTPVIYDDLSASRLNGFIVTQCDKKTGLLNLEGKEVFAPQYDHIFREYDDTSLLKLKTYVSEGTQEALATIDGKMVLLPEYSSIEELKEHIWLLQKDSSYFLYNSKTGKKDTLPFKMVSLTGENGVLQVNDDKGAGLFDPVAGVIAAGFENIYSFHDHIAIAQKQGKLGGINAQGHTVVPCIYAHISDFSNGLAVVQKDDERYGVIDSTGREIIPIEYDKPEGLLNASDYILDDAILLFKESPDAGYLLKGFARKDGKVIVPPQYEIMWKDENASRFLVRKNEKFGVLAADGTWLIPAIYDDARANKINSYTGVVSLSFPLLCFNGKNWVYVTLGGKELPYVADNISQTDWY